MDLKVYTNLPLPLALILHKSKIGFKTSPHPIALALHTLLRFKGTVHKPPPTLVLHTLLRLKNGFKVQYTNLLQPWFYTHCLDLRKMDLKVQYTNLPLPLFYTHCLSLKNRFKAAPPPWLYTHCLDLRKMDLRCSTQTFSYLCSTHIAYLRKMDLKLHPHLALHTLLKFKKMDLNVQYKILPPPWFYTHCLD